jgi:uncharacterized repeat protein (TIGR03803 family)
MDSAGNVYGTTFIGGTSGAGTVFKVDSKKTESVLYNFTGGVDGKWPYAGLIADKNGNLYGTTERGGDLNCSGGFGCGIVFKLDSSGVETVLYNFVGGADAQYPIENLIEDKNGNFYGVTEYGGDLSCSAFNNGCGTVFKVNSQGSETVLYSFTGSTDGQYPVARLVQDKMGNLYGTTYSGGAKGYGTIFKLNSSGHKTLLYSFGNGAEGAYPLAGLIMDSAGNLYGTTSAGGKHGFGTVFKLIP